MEKNGADGILHETNRFHIWFHIEKYRKYMETMGFTMISWNFILIQWDMNGIYLTW